MVVVAGPSRERGGKEEYKVKEIERYDGDPEIYMYMIPKWGEEGGSLSSEFVSSRPHFRLLSSMVHNQAINVSRALQSTK